MPELDQRLTAEIAQLGEEADERKARIDELEARYDSHQPKESGNFDGAQREHIKATKNFIMTTRTHFTEEYNRAMNARFEDKEEIEATVVGILKSILGCKPASDKATELESSASQILYNSFQSLNE